MSPPKDAGVAVLGAGSWGTVLSMLLGRGGHPVRLFARDPEAARRLQATRENEVHVPGELLPPSVRVTSDLADALTGAEAVVVAVPSERVADLAAAVRVLGLPLPRVVSASKGLEAGSLMTMTAVLRRELPAAGAVAALSGPNLSREIAAGQPAAAVVACEDRSAGRWLQGVFTTETFRAYTSSDVVGVELGGALKNVLALATGMLAELGLGANSQAAVLTRGLAEISRLGRSLGARGATFQGLAGMGDVIATCSSPLSRNFRAGRMAARGMRPKEIRTALGQAVEGLETSRAALELGSTQGVDMPISEQVHLVLHEGKDPRRATRDLMRRPLRPEHEEDPR